MNGVEENTCLNINDTFKQLPASSVFEDTFHKFTFFF